MMRTHTRLLSFVLCVVMILGMCPAVSTAATIQDQVQTQIGGHYEASDANKGALSASPSTSTPASKSYENNMLVTKKTIAPGDAENEFDITLEVQTQAKIEQVKYSEDAAAVIVIDMSSSMSEDRISAAKKAASAFIKKFQSSSATRKVAVVTFGNSARTRLGIWNTASDVFANQVGYSWSIGQTDEGTNLEAGLVLAEYLLKLDDVKNIANKNIVVLTDGKPTYHLISNYKIQKVEPWLSSDYYKITDQYTGGGNKTLHTTHTQTETTSKKIINSDIDIYGIYVGDENVLCDNGGSNCALAKKSKSAGTWLREDCGMISYALTETVWKDNTALSKLFESIAEEIEYRAEAWEATDPIGAMFNFDRFVTSHTDKERNDFYCNDNVITWRLHWVKPNSQVTDDKTGITTSTYRLTYKVKLDTLKTDYVAGTYYPTNGVTSLTYRIEKETATGTSEISKGTAYFNVPSVKGYAGNINFKKQDDSGKALAGATFTLTTSDKAGWSKTATSDANGNVSFANIPSGHSYTVTETTAPSGYDKDSTTYPVSIAFGTANGTIGTNGVVKNTRRVGSLTVSKTVTGANALAGASFAFTVKLKNADATPYTAPVKVQGATGTTNGDKTGVITFNLKNGEHLTFTDLPEGVKYTVTEASADNYTTTKTGDTGTIAANTTKTAAFINAYDAPKYGNLKISKSVVGAAKSDESFTFTVALTKNSQLYSGTFKHTKTTGTATGTATDLAFTNGSATITLKHGESVTIADLPAGVTYTVTETANSNYTTTVNSTASNSATGTIAENTTATAAFVNTLKTADLSISKSLTNSAEVGTKSFSFAVTAKAPNGNAITGAYNTTIGTTNSTVTFTNGNATVTVNSGESTVIKGLPVGTTFTVTETGADNYTTTVNSTETKAANGTIAVSGTSVSFANKIKRGDFSVSKTVAGTGADQNKEFTFKVTDAKLNGNAVSGTYSATIKTGNGSPQTTSVTFSGGTATFKLKHNQTITISGMPVGMTYTVTETLDSNYTTTPTNGIATGTISASEAGEILFTNTIKTSTLTINKTVSGEGAPTGASFNFKVKITMPNGQPFAITSNGVAYDSTTGEGTFTLASGQNLAITGVPVGSTYTVTETLDSNYTTTPTNGVATGTINSTSMSSAAFTNTYIPQVGGLTVTKTINALTTEIDSSAKFTFKLTVKQGETAIADGTYGGLSFTNGVATFELTHNGSKIITGLPAGASYTVEEVNATGYTTTSTNASGSIAIGGNPTVAFVNTPIPKNTFNFNIIKNVTKTGEVAPGSTTFNFIVSTSENKSDATAILARPTITVNGATSASAAVSVTTTSNVIYIWEVSDGAQGWTYDPAMFQISQAQGQTSVYKKATSSSIWASGYQLNDISFTNSYDQDAPKQYGDLIVSKRVTGKQSDEAFTFTVEAWNGTTPLEEGSYGDVTFISNGTKTTATFTLKSGAQKKITGLPAGTSYKVTEAAVENYTASSTNADGTIKANETITASFTNTYKAPATGTLTVKKTISGAGASTTKAFTFTVTASVNGTALNGTYGGMTFNQGTAIFTLKGGEQKTATNLPLNTIYTVVESDNSGYTVTVNDTATSKVEGKITDTTPVLLNFNNYKPASTPVIFPGNLTVTKVVQGFGASTGEAFHFTVSVIGAAPLNGIYGDMVFSNGIANFTLRGGESITATNLPAGTVYIVTETAHENYITSANGASGFIVSGGTSVATFTNTYVEKEAPDTGSLIITKKVTGDGADYSEYFTFTLRAYNGKTPLTGTYGGVTFNREGRATFMLKDGESKTVTDLPIGTSYTVTEANVNGYTVTANGLPVNQVDGKITDTTLESALFVNHKDAERGGIEITKTVKGNKAPITDIDYTFIVWVRSEKGVVIPENVTYKRIAADGTMTEKGNLTINTDGYTFTLKNGESIVFDELISGHYAEVHEITTGNFKTTSTGLIEDRCEIVANTIKKVEFVNDYGNAEPVTEPETPTTTPTTKPDPDRQLDDVPQTGMEQNFGFEFVLAGFALLGMAVLVIGKKWIGARRSR